MPVPDYQTLMLPLLRIAKDGAVYKFKDVIEPISDEFNLTEEERSELIPSGTQPLINNRVGWASTYLKQAGLLYSHKRGFFQITDEGKKLLNTGLNSITNATLEEYPCYIEFKKRRNKKTLSSNSPSNVTPDAQDSDLTPEDQIESAYKTLWASIEKDVLDYIKVSSPAFFERLVIDLLVNMGYGGSRKDAGKAVGKTNDGGIDGIIKEDRLGLDVIYIQAKRWEGTVGRPEIQKFAGALQGQRARKGVFITTSNFSDNAIEYASQIETKIILIDGDLLTSLMFDHSVGVSPYGSYELKKIDTDYFEESV